MVRMKSLLDQIAAVWQSRALVIKLLTFASIGVVNTAIDVLVFTAAYKLLALPLIASNVLSWLVAVSASYAMNTKLTFGRETGGIFRSKDLVRFIGSGILGVILATTTLVILSTTPTYSQLNSCQLLGALLLISPCPTSLFFVPFGRPTRHKVWHCSRHSSLFSFRFPQ